MFVLLYFERSEKYIVCDSKHIEPRIRHIERLLCKRYIEFTKGKYIERSGAFHSASMRLDGMIPYRNKLRIAYNLLSDVVFSYEKNKPRSERKFASGRKIRGTTRI